MSTLLLILVGCTPLTQYRQSALVPLTAPPPVVGSVVDVGEVGIGGGLDLGVPTGLVTDEAQAGRFVSALFPQPGDPGLWVTTHKGHLWARTSIVPGLEIGGRAEFGTAAGAVATSIGVPPVEGDTTWAAGGTVGAQYPLDTPISAAFRGELLGGQIPWSRWELVEGTQGETVFGDGLEFYAPDENGLENVLRASATMTVVTRIEGFEGDLGVGVVGQHTNVGFSDKIEAPLVAADPAFVLVGAMSYRYGPGRVGMHAWYVAAGRSDLAYGTPPLGLSWFVETFVGKVDHVP